MRVPLAAHRMKHNTKGTLKTASFLPLLFTALLTLSSCFYIGPHTLSIERLQYNMVINNTDNQELLLNLVRLKYRDSLEMLAVSNINSQLTLGGSTEMAWTIIEGPTKRGPDIGRFSLNSVYEDKPTITYSPLTGDKFVKNVISRIPLETLTLLYDSGWSVERIFRLCVQSVNGVQNAPTASGPTPKRAPEYKDFMNLVKLMRELQLRNDMDIDYQDINGVPVMTLRFAPEVQNLSETCKIKELLKLDFNRTSYPIVVHTLDRDPNTVRIRTRSVLSLAYYLSHAVEVSEEDVEKGKVTVTYYDSGSIFDWNELFHEFFSVKMSKGKPDDPYVAIKYRDKWFYIDDADLESKSTFLLADQVFAIKAGQIKVEKPTLTLPIGR